MAYSKIVISQNAVSGAAGVSRDDIDLYAVASKEVVLTNDPDGDVGVRTWAWVILERPAGSVVVLVGSDTSSATFEADVYGRYKIGLRVNGLGDYTEGYSELIVGCRPVSLGFDVAGDELLDWLPPSATEGFLANWSSNPYGAQPEIVKMMNQLRSRFLAQRSYKGLAHTLRIPIHLTRTVSTNNAVYQLSGISRLLAMGDFPWVKEAAFGCVFAQSGGVETAHVRLYDTTHAVAVVELSLSQPVRDFLTQVAVGSAAGNLRLVDTRYHVEIKSVPGGGADTAEIYEAFILLGSADFVTGAV